MNRHEIAIQQAITALVNARADYAAAVYAVEAWYAQRN